MSKQSIRMLRAKLQFRAMVYHHIVYNHHPHLPGSMTDACVRAIFYAKKGQYDKKVRLPDNIVYKGKYHTCPVSVMIEMHDLQDFVR